MKHKQIKNIDITVLSDGFCNLNKVTFDYLMSNGDWVNTIREVFDRGHGAAILLYNKVKQTVILTKQFRMPTYLHDNKDGFLVEVPAGMLDNDDPEACIIRETEEEVGYRLKSVKKVYEAYLSPGIMTEKMHFFIGEYLEDMRVGEGGGLPTENEDIEVLEIPFKKVVNMLNNGEIADAKTIVLLQYAIIHKVFN